MVFAVVFYLLAENRGRQANPVLRKDNKLVVMDNNLMARSQLLDARKDVAKAKQELDESKKREEDLKHGLPPAQDSRQPLAQPTVVGAATKRSMVPTPPMPQQLPPPVPAAFPSPPPPPPQARNAAGNQMAAPMVESEIGGIVHVQNDTKSEKAEDKKKDDKMSVYLAPSFMKATLLTGLYAPIGGDAKNNPIPMMIRVKAPARLPNDVKAQLQGCFVVADGKGNLATERADIVTVSLSCVDRKGEMVINEPITGYVTGGDNIAGVKGKVVAKTGQMIVRAAVAGGFGGAGDALKSTSQSTSLSALGQVSQFDPNKLAQGAAGGALSEGFKELQKFYMELAHQSMPVIEILPSQPLSVVITKESELHIKKLKKGSFQ